MDVTETILTWHPNVDAEATARLKTFLDCQTAMYINFDKMYIHYIYILYKWGFSPSLKYIFHIFIPRLHIFFWWPRSPPRAIPWSRRFRNVQPSGDLHHLPGGAFRRGARDSWRKSNRSVKKQTLEVAVIGSKENQVVVSKLFIRASKFGTVESFSDLAGGFKKCLFSPRNLGKMKPFWRLHIFEMGLKPPTRKDDQPQCCRCQLLVSWVYILKLHILEVVFACCITRWWQWTTFTNHSI